MRRYLFEMLIGLAAYAAVLVVSLQLMAHGLAPEGFETVVSVAPILPCLLLAWIIVRRFRRLDEMQLRMQMEAMAFAFAGTGLISFSYGFLENVGYPQLSMFAVWPLMCVLWGLGSLIVHLRYR